MAPTLAPDGSSARRPKSNLSRNSQVAPADQFAAPASSAPLRTAGAGNPGLFLAALESLTHPPLPAMTQHLAPPPNKTLLPLATGTHGVSAQHSLPEPGSRHAATQTNGQKNASHCWFPLVGGRSSFEIVPAGPRPIPSRRPATRAS